MGGGGKTILQGAEIFEKMEFVTPPPPHTIRHLLVFGSTGIQYVSKSFSLCGYINLSHNLWNRLPLEIREIVG